MYELLHPTLLHNKKKKMNCFGDIETDSSCACNDDQELIVIGDFKQEELLAREVDTICLVGSFIAECHQELRINLLHQSCEEKHRTQETSAFVRISRVNGTDTFQLVEAYETSLHVMEDLPTLLVIDKFPKTITLREVQFAFDQSRNLMKRYEQGNCHALSQMICDLLVPGSFPAELDW